MYRFISHIITIAVVSTGIACNSRETGEPVVDPEEQFEYFALKLGRTLEYQVDSLVYDFGTNGNTVVDTNRLFVKIHFADTLTDNSGQLVYLLERFERSSSGEPWVYKSSNTASRTSTQAFFTEENLRFNPMIFPMTERSRWDGNSAFDSFLELEVAGERIRPFTNWDYRVDSLDIPGTIGPFAFDSLLIITEANDEINIEKRYSRAVYAKHVGLVKKEQWILDSQYCNQIPSPTDCLTKPWEEKAEKGYILRMEILNFAD
jgi:hypothetical protein